MLASSRFARSFRVLGLVSCWFAALQACGGRSDTEDFLFNDGPGTFGGASGANVGASSSGGKNPGRAGSSATSGTGAGGSSVGQGGSSVGQGGSTSSGGVATAGTAAGGKSQGGVGGVGQGGVGQGGVGIAGSVGVGGTGQGGAPITCGDSVCNALTQICCATLGGFGCLPEDEECSGAVLNCGASSDCAGGAVCCLRIVDNVDSSSVCKNSCSGMGAGRERQLCASDAECTGQRRCRDTVFGVRVCTRL